MRPLKETVEVQKDLWFKTERLETLPATFEHVGSLGRQSYTHLLWKPKIWYPRKRFHYCLVQVTDTVGPPLRAREPSLPPHRLWGQQKLWGQEVTSTLFSTVPSCYPAAETPRRTHSRGFAKQGNFGEKRIEVDAKLLMTKLKSLQTYVTLIFAFWNFSVTAWSFWNSAIRLSTRRFSLVVRHRLSRSLLSGR